MNRPSYIPLWCLCAVLAVTAFWLKGVVLYGMIMGIAMTAATWAIVLKLPMPVITFMGRHMFFSDVFLGVMAMSLLSGLGPGPTLVMAGVTYMGATSIMLCTLPKTAYY